VHMLGAGRLYAVPAARCLADCKSIEWSMIFSENRCPLFRIML
jgi:hypothetical protein